jgi:hypothetical protein
MRNTPRNKAIVARPSPYDGGFGFFQALGLTQVNSSPPTFDDKDKYKLSIRIQNYKFIKSYLDKNLKPNDCLIEKQFGANPLYLHTSTDVHLYPNCIIVYGKRNQRCQDD